MSDPIFLLVTGSIRSGTTLLGELLYSRYEEKKRCRHPHLSFANDNINTLRELGAIHALQSKNGEPADVDRSITTLLERHQWPDTSRNGLRAMLQKQILEVAPTPNDAPNVYGVKSTGLLEDFLWMKPALGKTRQIIVFRDPRDVLASSLRRVSLMNRPPRQTSWWKQLTSRLMGPRRDPTVPCSEQQNYDGHVALTMTLNAYRFWKAHSSDKDIMMVQYEDLVRDPEGGLREILRFLDLPPHLYDWDSLKGDSIVSNSSFLIKEPDGAVPTGIQLSAIGRYKESLSNFDLWTTQHLLGSMMKDLGYPFEDVGSYKPAQSDWRAWLKGLITRTRALGYSTQGLEESLNKGVI